MLKKIFISLFVLGLLAAGAVGGWLYEEIVVDPGLEIRPENIRKILSKESEVFYSDGVTKIGVFFDTAHRQYLEFSEIPKFFVDALIAAEDNRFFSHFGFDVFGIARAMVKNFEAGRVVQGGSTLTQQTAKNLFKRSERSYEAKFKELLFALRLEYYYTKQQIFEFYANQFYVSGNGLGLGVAARYYFDKEPKELSLAECAFIAGSVKRPNAYNPFIKKDDEAEQQARKDSENRKTYVLGKMLELGMIDTFTYRRALVEELNFRQGKVGFILDYVMDVVQEAVSTPAVLEALDKYDISNVATAGLRIVTTIDKDLQDATLANLRGELSRLDVRLRGYGRAEVQGELGKLDYTGDSAVNEGSFLFGTIESIKGQDDGLQIAIDLDKRLGTGVIDAAGLKDIVRAWVKWLRTQWAEPQKGDQRKFLGELAVGDRVWVSVRKTGEDGNVLLNLERYPQVQGGALVMRQGRIKSMAGGSENRFFNRAYAARRTMGSSFKPLIYTAALQLGWNSADLLDNSRGVFVYHGKAYYPRPDHDSPFGQVSMNWAGVKSENLASVWLMAHLCDNLTPVQFRDVAGMLGLAPKVINGEEEPYKDYAARIRDRYGIMVTRDILRAAAYRRAINNLETDFIFDNMMGEYRILRQLPYGLYYGRFGDELRTELASGKAETQSERNEFYLRQGLLGSYFLRYQRMREELTSYQSAVRYGMPWTGASMLFVNSYTGTYSFLPAQYGSPPNEPVSTEWLRGYLQPLSESEQRVFWSKVKLENSLTAGIIDRVSEQLDLEYKKMSEQPYYTFDVLAEIDDFRITVGLYYVIGLAKELGIQSHLDPVLSFPLGSNVVTLLEATRMYEGLVTGKVALFGETKDSGPQDSVGIIDRIESEDGELLYRPTPHVKEVVDGKTALAVGSILENVVKFGTGREADKTVRLPVAKQAREKAEKPPGQNELPLGELPVPLLGKTGTANKYVNAAFLGYLPAINDNGAGLKTEDGYAVGVYVGYDDNRSMRRGATRISGALGALPTWCNTINNILQQYHYAEKLDPVDISFYGLDIKRKNLGQTTLQADDNRGGALHEPAQPVAETNRSQPSIITFASQVDGGRIQLERQYQPYWKTEALHAMKEN